MKIWVGLLLLLAWCAALPVAEAQYRAGIQGTVVDPQGAAVGGATLTLTSKDTGRTFEATTDEKGNYSFPNLGPGQYTVSVEQKGFKKKLIEDVAVAAEEIRGLDITLELGAVTELHSFPTRRSSDRKSVV